MDRGKSGAKGREKSGQQKSKDCQREELAERRERRQEKSREKSKELGQEPCGRKSGAFCEIRKRPQKGWREVETPKISRTAVGAARCKTDPSQSCAIHWPHSKQTRLQLASDGGCAKNCKQGNHTHKIMAHCSKFGSSLVPPLAIARASTKAKITREMGLGRPRRSWSAASAEGTWDEEPDRFLEVRANGFTETPVAKLLLCHGCCFIHNPFCNLDFL